jgi:crotonobetainyl-CoA:carnitine CoA-transferase CaiB-like acyl-CoA transferase
VCEVVGAPEWAGDPRFASTTLRAANQSALKDMLEAKFAGADATQWLERFRAAGVPSAPINGYAEALADPQAAHLGLVVDATLPGGRRTRTVGCPVRLDGEAVPVNAAFPALGGDTESLRAAMKEAK